MHRQASRPFIKQNRNREVYETLQVIQATKIRLHNVRQILIPTRIHVNVHLKMMTIKIKKKPLIYHIIFNYLTINLTLMFRHQKLKNPYYIYHIFHTSCLQIFIFLHLNLDVLYISL